MGASWTDQVMDSIQKEMGTPANNKTKEIIYVTVNHVSCPIPNLD